MTFSLKTITLAAVAISLIGLANLGLANAEEPNPVKTIPAVKKAKITASVAPAQEYYELRIYKINDFEKQKKVETYLSDALIPALNRMNLDRVGVFTNTGDVNDHSVFVLIRSRTSPRLRK